MIKMITITKLSGPFYRLKTKDQYRQKPNGTFVKYVGYDEVFIEDTLFIWWKALELDENELCIALDEMHKHEANRSHFGMTGSFVYTERI